MPINLYSTREMMTAIEQMMPVRTFLRDTFFSRVETKIAEQIDVDYKKGKRKMAPFVAPRVGGVVMDRQGYSTSSYKVPKIAPERITTGEDANKRQMGENIYSRKTPAERAAALVGKDLSEMDEFITRREEWMCREVLLNGKLLMKGIIDDKTGEYIEQEVNFGFTNKVALLGSELWSDAASDPREDLKQWRLDIIKATGKAPNVVIVASDVSSAFVNHPIIQKINDIRRYNFGGIEPKIINDAVTLVAYLPDLNLEIYSYDEWFIDDDGVEKAMMPNGNLVMARVGMGKRLYGAVTQLEDSGFVTIEGERIPKHYVDKDNEVIKTRLSARPLPVPEDVDGWIVATVL